MSASTSTKPTIETRGVEQAPRVDQTGRRPALVGHAIVFDRESELLGRDPQFVEVIRACALDRLADSRDVKCLIGHDAARVVGLTKAGTLRLDVDNVGLRFRLDPPNSPSGLDLVEAVERGDVDAMSFGFRVREHGYVWRRDRKPPMREIRDLDLFEISFVSWPAYTAAGCSIEQRALDEVRRIVADDRQHERWSAVRALETRLATLR